MGTGIIANVPVRKMNIEATPQDAGTGTDDCIGVAVIQAVYQFLGCLVVKLLELNVLSIRGPMT